jgi:hypothetical protein
MISIKKTKISGYSIDSVDSPCIELQVPCPIIHDGALPAAAVAGELQRAFR